jgi:hypothetical protein
MTMPGMDDEVFRFAMVDEAEALYRAGYRAAVRAIGRSAELRQRLDRARVRAAARLPLNESMRRVYREQVVHSEDLLRQAEFDQLQRHDGLPVPLVRQDWFQTVELAGTPLSVLSTLLDPDSPETALVLAAVQETPDLTAHLDAVDGRLQVFVPNTPTLGALVATLHEVGHFIYEVRSGRTSHLPFWHYVESEAAAMSYCAAEVRKYLADHGPDPAVLTGRWVAYQRAEILLNHYFFLEEATVLEFRSGPLPTMSMTYLRDNWMKSVGYQVVYAVASRIATEREMPVFAGEGRDR